ncbi:hypothetical protein COCMIDRAFT_104883, partial [Bipolaris oryzae ATCC 44560]
SVTYDHRKLAAGIPVRSFVLKQFTGGLVVRWVTTGESPLSYVFESFFALGNSYYMNRVGCVEYFTMPKAHHTVYFKDLVTPRNNT